jgi:hypothetical protein
MNLLRAIISGTMVWTMIFSSFIIAYYIPALKDSLTLQGLVIGVLILPFASLGSRFYFKKEKKSGALPVALIMALTAAILDAIFTVPFIEIPLNGRGYFEFFTDPLFWVLISEIILVVYLYWKIKIKPITE